MENKLSVQVFASGNYGKELGIVLGEKIEQYLYDDMELAGGIECIPIGDGNVTTFTTELYDFEKDYLTTRALVTIQDKVSKIFEAWYELDMDESKNWFEIGNKLGLSYSQIYTISMNRYIKDMYSISRLNGFNYFIDFIPPNKSFYEAKQYVETVTKLEDLAKRVFSDD